MSKKLSDREQMQWDAFEILQKQSLDELIQSEISIRKEFGMVDANLPFQSRNQIQRDRQAWIDEWGALGQNAKMVIDQQQEASKEYEMAKQLDEMFQHAIEDDHVKERISHAIEEKDAVFSYYELKDLPVPNATQQRFAVRMLELKDVYDGKYYEERRTLDDHDLAHEEESLEDLIKQHEIIRMHYQRAEYIPNTSDRYMISEMYSFRAEILAHNLPEECAEIPEIAEVDATIQKYHEERREEWEVERWEAQQFSQYKMKKDLPNDETVQKREEFLEQLKSVQEQNRQSVLRPKPH